MHVSEYNVLDKHVDGAPLRNPEARARKPSGPPFGIHILFLKEMTFV